MTEREWNKDPKKCEKWQEKGLYHAINRVWDTGGMGHILSCSYNFFQCWRKSCNRKRKKKRREWETELMTSQQLSSLIIHAGKMINLSKQRRPSSCHREADWPQPQWTTAASPVTSYKSVVTAGHFPVWLPASMNKVFLLFFPPPLLLRVCLLLWNFSSLVDQRTSWNVI